MLRVLTGYKAQVDGWTMVVVSEFDEWKVLLHGPNGAILGARQFNEQKAKDHAVAVARQYFSEHHLEEPAALADVQWQPTSADDWLVAK